MVTKTELYEVRVETFTQSTNYNGVFVPKSGCKYAWRRITAQPVSLQQAIALAEEQNIRAAVRPWGATTNCCAPIYDNGAHPGHARHWSHYR